MNISDEKMSEVFNEWQRQFRYDPEKFASEEDVASR